MRKLANNVPTAALHPNAPPMSQAAPVKAMPAPAPPGFTTPPPMNQVKMSTDKHRRAAGATLLSAALDVGMERLAHAMSPTAQKIHGVNDFGSEYAPEKTAGVREALQKLIDAKNKHLDSPVTGALSNLGQGLGFGMGKGLVSPFATLHGLPSVLRSEDISPFARAGFGAGALAGVGTVGYGAGRLGKSLVHKLTADDEHEHG